MATVSAKISPKVRHAKVLKITEKSLYGTNCEKEKEKELVCPRN